MSHICSEVRCPNLTLCPRVSGIGLESSILFASDGATVVLADINLQSAEHTASHISKSYPGAKTLVLKTDVGKEADIKRLVETTVEKFGRLDIMVSNIEELRQYAIDYLPSS